MRTNDIKKGMRIRMRNGWEGTMKDSRKGNTRQVEVYGYATETGDVYAHDIVEVRVTPRDKWESVQHTPEQDELRFTVKLLLG